MIYLSSDHHFWHHNVIKYCTRPYSTVEEMNEDMIKKWNDTVSDDDIVYYLGDFSLSTKALPIVRQLKGEKLLIPGNHDACFPKHKKHSKEMRKYLDAGFSQVFLAPQELDDFLLWHIPYTTVDDRYQSWKAVDNGKWLLHGHVHEKWKVKGKMINVGVDVWNFTPVSLDECRKIRGY